MNIGHKGEYISYLIFNKSYTLETITKYPINNFDDDDDTTQSHIYTSTHTNIQVHAHIHTHIHTQGSECFAKKNFHDFLEKTYHFP